MGKFSLALFLLCFCFMNSSNADLPTVPFYSCILTRSDKTAAMEINLARKMDQLITFGEGTLRVRTFENEGFEGYFFTMTFVPVNGTQFMVKDIKASGLPTSAHTDHGRGLVLTIEHQSPAQYIVDFSIQNNRAQMICQSRVNP